MCHGRQDGQRWHEERGVLLAHACTRSLPSYLGGVLARPRDLALAMASAFSFLIFSFVFFIGCLGYLGQVVVGSMSDVACELVAFFWRAGHEK
jgi:hypothetical protein